MQLICMFFRSVIYCYTLLTCPREYYIFVLFSTHSWLHVYIFLCLDKNLIK